MSQPNFRNAADTVPQEWPRLQHYLRQQGLALDLSAPPRQFAGGFGNLNYLVDVDGEPCVLRRPPPGPIPPGANDMAREHRVLSALSPHYAYAPRSLHYCADAAILGAHFLIMAYRPGLVIGVELPERWQRPETGARLAGTLVDLLAGLHAIDPAQVGLETFGKPAGFLARAVEGWAKRAAIATAGAPSPLIDEVVGWLRANPVAEGAPTLLHCDFKLDNLILDPDTLAPRAVLDWDMSTRGDPLFDLATLLSYWTEPGDPDALKALRQMPTTGHGFPSRQEVARAYAEQTGRDLSDFRFHRVLTLFKLGVVFLQLYARYRDGTTQDPRFAGFESIGHSAIDFAREVARGNAF